MSAVAVPAVDVERVLTAEGFAEIQATLLRSEISVYPARAWYPSQLGHPCDRYLVWRFTKWEEQAPHDETLQAIFNVGRERQPAIYRRLEQLGYEIVRESDRPQQWKSKGATISGRPDGRIVGFRGTRIQPARVLEVKTMSPYVWERLSTAEDLRAATSHYTRAYYAQGQLYAFLENLPAGVFVLEQKVTGMLKLIPFTLDYAYAESLLARVEALQPLVEQGVDPDPIAYQAGVCDGCGFRRLCYPPRDFGAGAAVLDDPALLDALDTRERARAARDEYEEADKAVKGILKRLGVAAAVAGPWQIEGKTVEVKASQIPARTEVRYTIRRAVPA